MHLMSFSPSKRLLLVSVEFSTHRFLLLQLAVSEIALLVFDYLDTLSSQRKERLSQLQR